jgi:AbrB family looped-hinge helix DNA binding protein
MQTAIVSQQGQVQIPPEIREKLGITPGSHLTISIEGHTIQMAVCPVVTPPTRVEEGYGMLVCRKPGQRNLADFDIATRWW